MYYMYECTGNVWFFLKKKPVPPQLYVGISTFLRDLPLLTHHFLGSDPHVPEAY